MYGSCLKATFLSNWGYLEVLSLMDPHLYFWQLSLHMQLDKCSITEICTQANNFIFKAETRCLLWCKYSKGIQSVHLWLGAQRSSLGGPKAPARVGTSSPWDSQTCGWVVVHWRHQSSLFCQNKGNTIFYVLFSLCCSHLHHIHTKMEGDGES